MQWLNMSNIAQKCMKHVSTMEKSRTAKEASINKANTSPKILAEVLCVQGGF
jgi:hypothetical protein